MFSEVRIAAVPHSFRKLIITSCWLIRTSKLFFSISLKFILMCSSVHVIVGAYGVLSCNQFCVIYITQNHAKL